MSSSAAQDYLVSRTSQIENLVGLSHHNKHLEVLFL